MFLLKYACAIQSLFVGMLLLNASSAYCQVNVNRPETPACSANIVAAGDNVKSAQSPDEGAENTQTAKEDNALNGVDDEAAETALHTMHPDAQWFGDAGFGLFIHWSICSVNEGRISWSIVKKLEKRIDDPAERERIVRERDWKLTGKPEMTPNEYWAQAEKFNPQKYDPNKWLKAAKAAGFTYVVFTTRHHDGFALWPSAYGNFNTKNYMNGRDLVKDYVEACRRNGLKVGLYYSPPDWYFDRDYMNFLHYKSVLKNPEFPELDADLRPRTTKPTPEEIEKHQKAFAEMVNGQIEELLTRYGKIDIIWFDGAPDIGNNKYISIERIRELQLGIVINPRLHNRGDFVIFERYLPIDKPVQGWAEFCNTWTASWVHEKLPFRAPGFILGQLAKCRSLGINYLPGVGPTSTGEFCDGIYENMAIIGDWMKINGVSVQGVKPLPAGESASVPATAKGSIRYLFALPAFNGNTDSGGGMYEKDLLPAIDTTITLKSAGKPSDVVFLGDGSPLKYEYSDSTITVSLPAAKRTKLVDVIEIKLPESKNVVQN